MDDIKKILLSKRSEVSDSLDELASVVKDIYDQYYFAKYKGQNQTKFNDILY